MSVGFIHTYIYTNIRTVREQDGKHLAGVNRRNSPKCPNFTCGSTEHVAFQFPRKKLEVRQATGPLGGVRHTRLDLESRVCNPHIRGNPSTGMKQRLEQSGRYRE